MPQHPSPLDAPPIEASTDPTTQLRIALDRGLAELALAKKHGVPGAIVRIDVLEQLTRSAARELAREPSIEPLTVELLDLCNYLRLSIRDHVYDSQQDRETLALVRAVEELLRGRRL